MKIRNSKKAITMTWSGMLYFIVGFLILCVIAAFIITSGTARVEREIKAHTTDIKSEETLVFYLSSHVSKGAHIKDLLSKSAYKTAEKLADSKTTFADLIIEIGENDSEEYKEILQKETEYLLNNTLGNEKWKLEIEYPDGKRLLYSDFKGETKIFQLNLPATGYQLINIKLTVKKEK